MVLQYKIDLSFCIISGGQIILAARCLSFILEPRPAILLEDLTTEGFKMHPRQHGLDLDHCLFTIQTLAHFHATSAALHEKVFLINIFLILGSLINWNSRLFSTIYCRTFQFINTQYASTTTRHKNWSFFKNPSLINRYNLGIFWNNSFTLRWIAIGIDALAKACAKWPGKFAQ